MDNESVDEAIRKKFQHLYKTKKGRDKDVSGYDVKEYKSIKGPESSPYLAYLSRRGNYNLENDAQEPVEANADSVPGPIRFNFDPEENMKYQKIIKALPKLTKRQLEVLNIIVYQNKSIRETAKILGINKSVIIKMLNTIRNKIDD